MALNVGNRGDREILYRMIGASQTGTWSGTAGDTLKLRLFKGYSALGKGDSKFGIIESNGTGYSAIYLAPASWTISTLNPGAGDTTLASYTEQTFTYTGADSVKGYFLTTIKSRGSTGDSILVWMENFSSVFSIPAGGGTIRVTPKIQMA